MQQDPCFDEHDGEQAQGQAAPDHKTFAKGVRFDLPTYYPYDPLLENAEGKTCNVCNERYIRYPNYVSCGCTVARAKAEQKIKEQFARINAEREKEKARPIQLITSLDSTVDLEVSEKCFDILKKNNPCKVLVLAASIMEARLVRQEVGFRIKHDKEIHKILVDSAPDHIKTNRKCEVYFTSPTQTKKYLAARKSNDYDFVLVKCRSGDTWIDYGHFTTQYVAFVVNEWSWRKQSNKTQ